MKYAIVFLGLLLIAASFVMLIKPKYLSDFLTKYSGSRVIHFLAFGVRIVFGIMLYLIAPQTRFPLTIEVFSILFIIAGVVIIFIPLARFEQFLLWVVEIFKPYIRIVSPFAFAMGAFLIYAVW